MPSFFTLPAYALTFVVVLVIWATPDVFDSITKHPRPGAADVRDGHSHQFFRLGLSLGLIAAGLLAHFRPQDTLPYHRPWLFTLGIVIVLAGFALRRWATMATLAVAFCTCVTVSWMERSSAGTNLKVLVS